MGNMGNLTSHSMFCHGLNLCVCLVCWFSPLHKSFSHQKHHIRGRKVSADPRYIYIKGIYKFFFNWGFVIDRDTKAHKGEMRSITPL